MADTKLIPADFAPLPLADKGDDDGKELYAALGYASSCWENAVANLGLVFVSMLGTDQVAALRAFGTINMPGQQIDVIRATAEIAIKPNHPDLYDKSYSLTKVVEKASHRRNELVHSVVTQLTTTKLGTIGNVAVPNIHTRKVDISTLSSKFRFNSSQVLRLAHKFNLLRDELFDLQAEIAGTLKASP